MRWSRGQSQWMGAHCDCTLHNHNHNHNGWVQQGIVTSGPVSLCEPSMSLVAGGRHGGFGNFEGRDLYNWSVIAKGMHSYRGSKFKTFHGNDEMTMIQEVHWNCYLVNSYTDNISWKNQKEAWYKSITTRGRLINGDNTRRCAACQLYRKTWRIINNAWHHMT